jgi:hypothetical protein
MTFKGFIKGSSVQLSGPTGLPDGTEVDVAPTNRVSTRTTATRKKPATRSRAAAKPSRSPRKKRAGGAESPLLKILASLPVETGIVDLASEHDHYLYGTPRKSKPRRSRVTRKNA